MNLGKPLRELDVEPLQWPESIPEPSEPVAAPEQVPVPAKE